MEAESGIETRTLESGLVLSVMPSLPCHCTTTAPNAIERNGAGAQEDQRKSYGSQRKRELISAISQKTIFPMHFPNGHRHIDKNGKRRNASE
jgi:hypothetical protein